LAHNSTVVPTGSLYPLLYLKLKQNFSVSARMAYQSTKMFEWYCKMEIGSSFVTLFSNIFRSSEHLVEREDSKCPTHWSVITFPVVELCL